MKKKKMGILASALMVCAVCASLIAGSTFALFTSNDSVNIAVTSGKVAVTTTIENAKLTRYATVDTATGATSGEATELPVQLANGKDLTLQNVIPGDQVDFDLNIANNGTVAAKYQYGIESDTGLKLLSAFDVTITNGEEVVLNQENNLMRYTSAWGEIAADTTTTYHVTLALAGNVGNEYQDIVAKLAIKAFAVQANADVSGDAVVEYYNKTASNAEELAVALAAGGNVTLTEDITLTAPVKLEEGTSAELTLNGKTVTFTSAANADSTRPFVIKAGAELTVYGEGGNVYVTQPHVFGVFDNYGTLNVYGGHYETNGSNNGGVVRGRVGGVTNIYGGEYVCTGFDPAMYDEGDSYIEDGYFYTNSSNRGNHNYCLQNVSSTMIIKNAVVRGIQGGIFAGGTEMLIENCDVEVRDYLENNDTITYYALYVNGNHEEAHCVVKGGTFKSAYHSAVFANNNVLGDGGECLYEKLEIDGGTFIGGSGNGKGLNGLCVGAGGDVEVRGGTFNSDVSKWVSDGYVVKQASDTLYTVVPEAIDLTDETAAAFCPDCYNGKGEHSEHTPYLDIDTKTGVANVSRNGANLGYAINVKNATYKLSYDVDLTNLGEGAFIAFDCGEGKNWQNVKLGFTYQDGKYIAHNTLSGSEIGKVTSAELDGATVHVEVSFEENNGALKMSLKLNGKEFVTRTAPATEVNMYWNVYTYEANGIEDPLCALSNITFTSVAK